MTARQPSARRLSGDTPLPKPSPTQRASGVLLICSSENLPPAHEFEFDLGLPHGPVESGLPDARRGARPVRVEQLQDAALPCVIADLRYPLDLANAICRR